MKPKYRKFVNEYLKDYNPRNAAIRTGYSVKTASQKGSDLMKVDEIKEELDKRMSKMCDKVDITVEKIVEELANIAFNDGSKYAVVKNGNVEVFDTSNLTEGQRKAISNIKVGKNGIEVGTYDKMRALETLGKHLGMFVDRSENINVGMTYEQYLKDVQDENEY